MNKIFRIVCLLVMVAGLWATRVNGQSGKGKVYKFSHNDYEREKPLFSALEHGFNAVEADVHLIGGKLYVSHDEPDTTNCADLEELYLQPLSAIARKNDGVIQPLSPLPFYLMIDFKTEGETTYAALADLIESYRFLFHRIENGKEVEGAIHLFISGNRPDITENTMNRICGLDGRINDLGKNYSADLYPVVSDNWRRWIDWDGSGEMPRGEYKKLKKVVNEIHSEGKLVRFWAVPETEAAWKVLLKARVDFIGTDELEKLKNFMDNE